MTNLLKITAVIELGTGLALLAVPVLVAVILLGVPLDAAAALVVDRVAGAALLALGIACWFASREAQSCAASGVVAGMLVYNIATTSLLVYARCDGGMNGIGLWPAVVLHGAMAGWCVVCLGKKRMTVSA